jgi:hypothetical protein
MSGNRITKEEVISAQKEWGDGIVAIGSVFSENGDIQKAAEEHVDKLYAYEQSTVLFKPTKAKEEQFRGNRDKALSYFIAKNNSCSEDKGFALQPWTNVRFENTNIVDGGDIALAMGNYFFTTTEGEEVKVEYSFGYMKDGKGNLRINLHHSSLPFNG